MENTHNAITPLAIHVSRIQHTVFRPRRVKLSFFVSSTFIQLLRDRTRTVSAVFDYFPRAK